MHPALPAAQLTIVKGHRPHGIALDGHDKVASYVGKEAGPSRIGSDMHDPICFICFPCYRSIKKNRSNKLCAHVSMLPMIHVTMFQHCSATGGYHHQNQFLPIECVCVCACAHTKTTRQPHKSNTKEVTHTHTHIVKNEKTSQLASQPATGELLARRELRVRC